MKSVYPQNIHRTVKTRGIKGRSVDEERRTRRPISRVLWRRPKPAWRSFLWTAPRGTVLATYPDRSGLRQPYPLARAHGPYSVLLLVGLAMPPVSPRARCALTAPFHPYPSEERRFVFCGAIPRVAPGGRYPPPCRRGARTFLDPPKRTATAQPSGPGRKVTTRPPQVNLSLEPQRFGEGQVVLDSPVRQPHPAHEPALLHEAQPFIQPDGAGVAGAGEQLDPLHPELGGPEE